MISQLGLRISAAFRRTAPDPFVLAILLTLLTAVLALALGFRPERAEGLSLADRSLRLLDAWGPRGGIWTLLPFAMQMCLILVTGHALAASRPVRLLITRAADIPRSAGQAAAMVALLACLSASINWGLGLIVGAFLARAVGLSMSRRGLPAHYPLLAAAGYTGMMVWHGGFSGSAPLTMTTRAGVARTLPEPLVDRLAAITDGQWLPLDQTIASPSNLIITGGLVLLIPLIMWRLAPQHSQQMQPITRYLATASPTTARITPVDQPTDSTDCPGRIPDWLERSPWLAWVLAAIIIAAMIRFNELRGIRAIGLDEVNATMLALGLLMHGSTRSYAAAVEEAARGCAGIILQFPLYAGIVAMMTASGLVHIISGWFLSIGNATTIPLLSFISAGIVNFFVPSGGGQWAVQGPIAIQAGLDSGVDPARMVMSVAYGDQLTNMLQPFWALPLLAITGVRARDIVGYTAIVMLFGAAWIGFWLLVL